MINVALRRTKDTWIAVKVHLFFPDYSCSSSWKSSFFFRVFIRKGGLQKCLDLGNILAGKLLGLSFRGYFNCILSQILHRIARPIPRNSMVALVNVAVEASQQDLPQFHGDCLPGHFTRVLVKTAGFKSHLCKCCQTPAKVLLAGQLHQPAPYFR